MTPLDEFYITVPSLPSQTAVDLYIAKQASSKPKRQKDPAWAVLLLLVGAFLLVTSGVFLLTYGSMR